MENITELIQASVRTVKNKTVPVRVASAQSSYEGDLVLKQRLYDYFGLDFKSRTAKEMQDINKKVDVIRDYLNENFDDLSAGLTAIEQQGGAVPADGNLLDHFYRVVKFKSEAFESLPAEQQEEKQTSRVKDAQGEIDRLREELRSGADKMSEAKELQKLALRMERLEIMKASNQKKLEKLQAENKRYLDTIQKQRVELTDKINDSTPSPTV